MKIIDDNGYTWVLKNYRIQCLESLAAVAHDEDDEINIVERMRNDGYHALTWVDALRVLLEGGYINCEPEELGVFQMIEAIDNLKEKVAELKKENKDLTKQNQNLYSDVNNANMNTEIQRQRQIEVRKQRDKVVGILNEILVVIDKHLTYKDMAVELTTERTENE